MEWFIAVVVVAALGVAAIVAAGGLGSMPADPTRDVFRQDLPEDRRLTGEDLRRLRFGVAVRGYAMNQVDDVLDRLSGELAERDQRILDLESLLTEHGIAAQPAPESPAPESPDTALDSGRESDDAGLAGRKPAHSPSAGTDPGDPGTSGSTVEYLR